MVLDDMLKCETGGQVVEVFGKMARILREANDPLADEAEMLCLEFRKMPNADALESRDDFISGLRHSLELEVSMAEEIAAFQATAELVKAAKCDIDASIASGIMKDLKKGHQWYIFCPNCGAAFLSPNLLNPLRDKLAQLLAKISKPGERDFWLKQPMPKPVICTACEQRFLVTITGQDISSKILILRKELRESEERARKLRDLHAHDRKAKGQKLSERVSFLLVGLLAMLIGIGMFLWDWYGEYIHFVWFIPFFILGPIMFIIGLVAVIKALFPSRKSFKETMPPLARMEKKKDVKGLIKALRHRDKDVRISAARALGEIGDTRAVDPLTRALKDKNLAVQEAVKEALQKIKAKKS